MTNLLVKSLVKLINHRGYNISLSPPLKEDLLNNTYWITSCRLFNSTSEAVGYGSDQNKSYSILKSISEAIERITENSNSDQKLNGVASHLNSNLAFNKAFSEMIERDSFIRCHTQNTFPNSVNKKGDILFFDLPTIEPSHICMLVTKNTGGLYPFGLACGIDKRQVISSALNELALLSAVCKTNKETNKGADFPIKNKHTLCNEFVTRMLSTSTQYSNPIRQAFTYKKQEIRSPFSPIKIVGVSSKNLFQWDTRWLNKMTSNSHNEDLLSIG